MGRRTGAVVDTLPGDPASHVLCHTRKQPEPVAQQWKQRKAEQLEVTRAMLTELRNEIRAATRSIRLPRRATPFSRGQL